MTHGMTHDVTCVVIHCLARNDIWYDEWCHVKHDMTCGVMHDMTYSVTSNSRHALYELVLIR